MHFVREPQYEEDIELIENEPTSLMTLDMRVESACRATVRSQGYSMAVVPWSGSTLFTCYCVTGGLITLLSLRRIEDVPMVA
jgi:hypothetical protein